MFVPGGMGPPELLVFFVILAVFFAVPIAIIVSIYELFAGSGDDERVRELERRVEELEDERS
ncbi:hypothetical protein [Natrinema salsiterrestre]|uniref:Preprotein translocase subunit TatA n=1 Tax=Natrinema salsiterrestre TaxID=2950540 RepID=A0A9Q4Q0V7_9EURY|nr:hypothetical protein [Natrinema salsiterrestre]MDF9744766.1 hypothetical protein [Natrinema salsiterrestre]